MRRQRRKASRALGLTLALSTGLAALVLGLRGPYARFLAAHWRQQLETVPDDRALTLLNAVAELGEPGIPVLVEALGSERKSVAGSGKRVLLSQLAHWERLRAREYSPKLAVLAKALAERVEQFGPSARADAADLATGILELWTLDETVVDPAEVIASCEKVLRTTGAERHLVADQGRFEPLAYVPPGGEDGVLDSADPTAGQESPDSGLPQSADPLSRVAKMFGGGLPIESLRGPPDSSRQGPQAAGDDPYPSSLRQPPELLADPETTAAIGKQAPLPGDRTTSEPAAPDDLAESRSESTELAGVDTVELMRRLQAADARTAAQARAELVRRGFREVHLQLARWMFDPDPAMRMRLVRLLPGLPNVDAVPWLLQLTRDEDPQVRLAAIGLMATTGDPAVLEAIETIAREDPDPRIRGQAERVSQRRREARY